MLELLVLLVLLVLLLVPILTQHHNVTLPIRRIQPVTRILSKLATTLKIRGMSFCSAAPACYSQVRMQRASSGFHSELSASCGHSYNAIKKPDVELRGTQRAIRHNNKDCPTGNYPMTQT